MADSSNKITGYEQKMELENDIQGVGDGALSGELYDGELGEDNSVGSSLSGNLSSNYTVDELLEMYLGPKQVSQSTKMDTSVEFLKIGSVNSTIAFDIQSEFLMCSVYKLV